MYQGGKKGSLHRRATSGLQAKIDRGCTHSASARSTAPSQKETLITCWPVTTGQLFVCASDRKQIAHLLFCAGGAE